MLPNYLADTISNGPWGGKQILMTTPRQKGLMNTPKVEGVYPMAFETFANVLESRPRFIDGVYNVRRLHSALGYTSPVKFEKQHSRQVVNPVG